MGLSNVFTNLMTGRTGLKDVLQRVAVRLDRTEPVLEEFRVGANVVIYGSAKFDRTYGRHIFIDDDTIVSGDVRILTHDGSSQRMVGATLIRPVHIGKRCFIGAGSVIMPGVTIGDDCVVGASAVVTTDVPNDSVVAGVPARVIGSASELHERRREQLSTMTVLHADGHRGLGLAEPTHTRLIALADTESGYYITWDDEKAERL